jgi:hypothetical protein
VYPGEYHGTSLPYLQHDRYQRWLGWFDKYTSTFHILMVA